MLLLAAQRATHSAASLGACRMCNTRPAIVHYTTPIKGDARHGEYVGFETDPMLEDPSRPSLVDQRVVRQPGRRTQTLHI